jgi:hypothetical protein
MFNSAVDDELLKGIRLRTGCEVANQHAVCGNGRGPGDAHRVRPSAIKGRAGITVRKPMRRGNPHVVRHIAHAAPLCIVANLHVRDERPIGPLDELILGHPVSLVAAGP